MQDNFVPGRIVFVLEIVLQFSSPISIEIKFRAFFGPLFAWDSNQRKIENKALKALRDDAERSLFVCNAHFLGIEGTCKCSLLRPKLTLYFQALPYEPNPRVFTCLNRFEKT